MFNKSIITVLHWVFQRELSLRLIMLKVRKGDKLVVCVCKVLLSFQVLYRLLHKMFECCQRHFSKKV